MTMIVLFDIDKTLVAKSSAHIRAFCEAVGEVYGMDARLSVITHHGMTDQQIVREVLRAKNVPETAIDAGLDKCLRTMTDRFDEYNRSDTVELLPGVTQLLNELKQRGCFLGLVTGNLETIAWGKLTKAGIAQYFSFGGFGSDHMDRRELASLAVQRCNALYPASKGSAVVLFGDTPNDIIAAHSVGALAAGVATGYPSKEQLRAAGADIVFDNLSDTEAVIKAVFGGL
jgi:phosphoglycolate phosphatase